MTTLKVISEYPLVDAFVLTVKGIRERNNFPITKMQHIKDTAEINKLDYVLILGSTKETELNPNTKAITGPSVKMTINTAGGATKLQYAIKQYIDLVNEKNNEAVFNTHLIHSYAEARELNKSGILVPEAHPVTNGITADIEVSGDIRIDGPEDTTMLSHGFMFSGTNDIFIVTEEAHQDQRMMQWLAKLLETYPLTYHNGKFDLNWVQYWLRSHLTKKLSVHDDTMLMHYALYPGAAEHGLKMLAQRILGAEDWEADIKTYIRGKAHFENIPRDVLYKYNAHDVWNTDKLKHYLMPQLEANLHINGAYRNILIPGSSMLQDIERSGIRVDIPYLHELDTKFKREISVIVENLQAIVGDESFNPNSPIQVKKYLASEGINVDSTNEATITKLQERKNLPEKVGGFLASLTDNRKASKIHGTYVKGILKKVKHNRVHSTYKLHGTTTGRLSSSSPNCVDGETEVLTPHGWLPFDELTDQSVLQVNAITGKGSFVKPEEFHCVYADTMIEIASEWGTFKYTDEHRLPMYTRKNDLCWDTASGWIDKHGGHPNKIIDRKVMRAAKRVGGLILNDEELFSLRIAVMVQAEGEYVKWKGGYYRCSVTSDRKKDQLVDMFGNRVVQNSARWTVSIQPDEVKRWIEIDNIKTFKATEILALDINALNVFLTELWKWDGDSTRECTYAQTAKRRFSVDTVQAVMALTGRSTKRYYNPKNDLSVVNSHREMFRHQSRTTINRVAHNALVYCVTVPTGAFMIRRNGAVLVTGNCQNVPRDKEIRRIFISDEERNTVLIGCDYSQAELRTMAELSDDTQMIEDFQIGAADFFDGLLPAAFPHLSEKSLQHDAPGYKDLRAKVKGVVYGLSYGRKAKAIAIALKIDEVQALAIIDGIFDKYPQWAEWRAGIMPRVYEGTLSSPWGRRFQQDVITYASKVNIENAALAFLPQSTASDICFTAAMDLHAVLPGEAHIVALVHDAITVEAPGEIAKDILTMMYDIMPKAATKLFTRVPFLVEGAISTRWDEV